MPAFISLEGGEGVGKTTQVRLLKERLSTLFPEHPFVFTNEPGGTPFAQEIRALILGNSAKEADGKTMFGLFIAARADHIRTLIKPSLEQGVSVLSDRYVMATYAYQVFAQEGTVSEEFFAAYMKELSHRPDVTIVLDMDPAVAIPRSRGRGAQEFNHFDARELAFHQQVRLGYRSFAQKYATNQWQIVFVDADRSIEVVNEDIVSYIGAALAA